MHVYIYIYTVMIHDVPSGGSNMVMANPHLDSWIHDFPIKSIKSSFS